MYRKNNTTSMYIGWRSVVNRSAVQVRLATNVLRRDGLSILQECLV
jgi:hypothetical protein